MINHFSKTFILRVEGPQPNWKPASSTDLSGFGRHYLVRSYHNSKVRRHYTVANCMKREAYDEYVSLITQFRQNPENNSTFIFNQDMLPENNQGEAEIIFVCKNYKVEGGLSHRLHNNKEDLCQIKGVLGKGLGID